MTLGQKIKEVRKQAGLSQEQFSEKLNVSRSAVAKWETDKGIPDIHNLKAISALLCVSIDYLLDDGTAPDITVLREPVDLDRFGKGRRKVKKDKLVREKYPGAEICTLLAEIKETKGEKAVDFLLGFFTDAPFGIPAFLNQIKNLDKEYYLVEQENKQFIVLVTDEFLESRELTEKQYGKKFEIGSIIFRNCGPIVHT